MPTKQLPCQTPRFSSLRGSLTFAASRIIAFPYVFSAAKLRKPLSVSKSRPLFPVAYRYSPPNPRIPSSIPRAGQAQTAHPGAIHVYSPSNRSQPPQRPKIHRPYLSHRQSRLLHERLQNRHPRQIPRPPLRRPRRSRSAHRRLLPPPPTHHPRCPRPRRRPHLLRVDSPPPPHRRNPSLAIPERQQVQRPAEVPPRTVRHLPLRHLLQTPVPPRCHPPRPLACPRCPRQTQG